MNHESTLIRIATHGHLRGLFSTVGRKFEKTKRAFSDDGQAEWACESCEEPVADEYEYCPHCGEDAVEPVE